MEKTYLSRRELLIAVEDHVCCVCHKPFSKWAFPVVRRDRKLVHPLCETGMDGIIWKEKSDER